MALVFPKRVQWQRLQMASFLAYILYTQTHCLVKVLGSTVTGTSTTIDATRPLVDALKVRFPVHHNSAKHEPQSPTLIFSSISGRRSSWSWPRAPTSS